MRAVLASAIVTLTKGVKCPACGTEHRPEDVEAIPEGYRIICRACHRITLEIERLTR